MLEFAKEVINLFCLCINWDAVSAIGAWFGGIATFLAALFALYPYLKKGKAYFITESFREKSPTLIIMNYKPTNMIIEHVSFYVGPVFLNKCFYTDWFLKNQDDLVSNKYNIFVKPYDKLEINYSANRLLHDFSHFRNGFGKYCYMNVLIVVNTNIGKIRINTKGDLTSFIEDLLSYSDAYAEYDAKGFVENFLVILLNNIILFI